VSRRTQHERCRYARHHVYLHYVFDLWTERWRRREATGDMIIVRYADNVVVGFEHERDARRFWAAMCERLQEFSLSLHPDKTRLIEFGRYAAARRSQRGLGKPETFNFLGFSLISGKSRRGKFLLKRKTRRDRMGAKLKEIKEALRQRMHQPIPKQGAWLVRLHMLCDSREAFVKGGSGSVSDFRRLCAGAAIV
jgi:RNA-directed DNA polymerase